MFRLRNTWFINQKRLSIYIIRCIFCEDYGGDQCSQLTWKNHLALTIWFLFFIDVCQFSSLLWKKRQLSVSSVKISKFLEKFSIVIVYFKFFNKYTKVTNISHAGIDWRRSGWAPEPTPPAEIQSMLSYFQDDTQIWLEKLENSAYGSPYDQKFGIYWI